jgi:hypothetical protein
MVTLLIKLFRSKLRIFDHLSVCPNGFIQGMDYNQHQNETEQVEKSTFKDSPVKG